MSRLKSRPFCGGKARVMLEEEDMFDNSLHNIYCTNCGAQFWSKSKTEAITKWNRRVDGWVSVKERYPIEQDANSLGLVLTYSTCGLMREASVPLQGVNWYWIKTTHWMPLSEPPQVSD